eukprot:gnl/TRDRNA2_/TRDRNA2_177097_c2_seq1.p2 gnl/TRDRNA2_/TRDRNA2_177097_c2~~gnl/TRDRNA2_/TRDRNA2_177097_c2_seq1.p2  ORF type:complete len:102 (+),score=3.88 gnl/TRDRNA2_/TRDRNA2_177097_c2_seq1:60-365(+)
MAVYVDNVRIPWRGKEWCHLLADSLEELHQFAAKIGLRRAWFQRAASYPHYDITVSVRTKALRLGAIAATRPEIIASAKRLKQQLRVEATLHERQLTLFEE